MADSTQAESENFLKRVRRMLGLNLDSWNNLMVGFLSIAAFFGVLAAASTYCVVELQKKDARDSAERTASLELQTEQLRKIAGPRSINQDAFLKALMGHPKLPVQIWYLPDVSDGFWLANQLVSALINAHWVIIEPPLPIPEDQSKSIDKFSRFIPRLMRLGAQPNGVTVVAHGVPSDIDKKNEALSALVSAIAMGSGAGAYGGFNSSVPEGTLRVIIAAKPDPILLSPVSPNLNP